MNKPPKFVLAVSAILICLAALASGQTASRSQLDAAIESLFAVRRFEEVAVSPQGDRVAWVESLHEKNGAPSANSSIFVTDLSSPEKPPRRITAGMGARAHAEHDLAWSPDGKRLAFLSDARKPGQLELYVVEAAGGAPRRLTNVTGFLADPQWSPDAKTLAVLFTENAPRAAGPLEPMTRDEGVVESHIYEQRLTRVDVATGRVRQLSPPDLYIYEYGWSPDGKNFVATAAHGNGDDNWYIAELYTVSGETGETKSIFKPPLQIACPRWSPDGEYVAFIAGLMSDEGNIGGDMFVMPATGGEPRNLTPRLPASASSVHWLPSSKEILFVSFIEGTTGIGRAHLDSGKVETVWSGAEALWKKEGASLGLALSRDGKTTAVIRNSFDRPPEVWAGKINNWKQITDANRGAKRTWGKAESVRWRNDHLSIQGWLLYPGDYDPAKHYPLVVVVHGGPGWAYVPRWPDAFFNVSALSAAGYFVLLPNPRGSFGEGEAFTRANVKDFGYGDFRDILAGVDQEVKTLPVDDHRIGITGWSYGGFMTMWAVTQTERFRAAVAGAGLSDWLSYYGENDLDQWMIPFFGASVYDDPAVYAKSSPINFIKNAKTPTLVLVGDRDGECPAPQSYEFWHALKTLGVETQFVIYPDEGHEIHDPAHRRDIIERTVGWFNEYLR